MMKQIVTNKVSLLAVAVSPFILAACSDSTESVENADSPPEVELAFSTWHPPLSKEVKTVWEPLLAELERRSDGRIKCRLHAGGALGKGPEHFSIVANGISDIGYFTATWTPGEFPLSDVLSVAVAVNGKDVATDIGNAVYQDSLKTEFEKVHVVQLNGCIQAYLWTTRPVTSLSDCKGLRIRTPGGLQTEYIQALGAEPILMPLGDVYTALEAGTIDGVVTCPPLVTAFKLYEVAKFGVLTTFGCVAEGVVMNKRKWDSLPDDLKSLVIEVCSNPYRTTGGLDSTVYSSLIDEIRANGVKLSSLSSDEDAKWFSLFQEKTGQWAVDLEKKGLPAGDTLRAYCRAALEKGVEPRSVPPEYNAGRK